MPPLKAYEGRAGTAEPSGGKGVFIGELLRAPDLVTCEAETGAALERAFHAAVDACLARRSVDRRPDRGLAHA